MTLLCPLLHARDARCAPPYILHIFLLVSPPIGSDRPPWAAGEFIIVDQVALTRQGDNRFGSIHPSVCVSACVSVSSFVCTLTAESLVGALTITSPSRLCVCNQGAYADNFVDVVDRLLLVIFRDV